MLWLWSQVLGHKKWNSCKKNSISVTSEIKWNSKKTKKSKRRKGSCVKRWTKKSVLNKISTKWTSVSKCKLVRSEAEHPHRYLPSSGNSTSSNEQEWKTKINVRVWSGCLIPHSFKLRKQASQQPRSTTKQLIMVGQDLPSHSMEVMLIVFCKYCRKNATWIGLMMIWNEYQKNSNSVSKCLKVRP